MYDQDARAFAVALYLDHGFSYDEISFLFRDSRKFMGDRPSGGGGLSQGPAASTIMEWVHRFLDNGDINPVMQTPTAVLCSRRPSCKRSKE